jgi:hypothetical protein
MHPKPKGVSLEVFGVRVHIMTTPSHHLGYIELEFERLFVVGTYVPNSGENFKVRFAMHLDGYR